MIYSEKLGYVYIEIPKTGSASVSTWLVEHFGGQRLRGRRHRSIVPSEFDGFFIFTVVRNPYERTISSWWYDCWQQRKRSFYTQELPYGRYLKQLIAFQRRSPTRSDGVKPVAGHFDPQMGFVRRAGCSIVVPLERFDKVRCHLPFVGKKDAPRLPHENRGDGRPPRAYLDVFAANPKFEQLAWNYYHEDFAAFGYRRYSPEIAPTESPPSTAPWRLL